MVSITTQRHENGEHSQWQVMEVSEHQEKVIYNLPLQHLCLDLENIEERAKKVYQALPIMNNLYGEDEPTWHGKTQ